jgi:hypothetical protein
MPEAAAGSVRLPAAPGGAPEEALIGETVWGGDPGAQG